MADTIKLLLETAAFGRNKFYCVMGYEDHWIILVDDVRREIAMIGDDVPHKDITPDDFLHKRIKYYVNTGGKKTKKIGKIMHVYVRWKNLSKKDMKRGDVMLSTGEGYFKGPLGSVYRKWK